MAKSSALARTGTAAENLSGFSTSRKESPGRQRCASHHGQLLHTQECRSSTLAKAEEAAPISFPFHPHQQFLVESGGAILCPDHRKNDPPRNIPQHGRAGKRHLPVAWP